MTRTQPGASIIITETHAGGATEARAEVDGTAAALGARRPGPVQLARGRRIDHACDRQGRSARRDPADDHAVAVLAALFPGRAAHI